MCRKRLVTCVLAFFLSFMACCPLLSAQESPTTSAPQVTTMSSKELLKRAIKISTRLETINAQRLTPSDESKAELIALRKDLDEALTKLAQAKAESMQAKTESTASKAELIATEKQLTKAQTDLSSLESSFANLKDEALKERRRADKAERSAKFWGRVAFVATLLCLGSAIHDSLD